MKKILKNKKGEMAVFFAIIFAPLAVFMSIALSRNGLFAVKTEIRGYVEQAASHAVSSAITLSDNRGQFCMIINDNDNPRFDVYEQITTTLYENLQLNFNVGVENEFSPITIVSIGTKNKPNAWGWDEANQKFNSAKQDKSALKKIYQKGEVDMVVVGYYKPSFLLMPDAFKGFKFTVSTNAKCLVYQGS